MSRVGGHGYVTPPRSEHVNEVAVSILNKSSSD